MIETYKFRAYRITAQPGPNSNTFVQTILNAVQDCAVLPPTASAGLTREAGSTDLLRTGVFVSLAGYLGVTIGWPKGLRSISGAVLGFDVPRPYFQAWPNWHAGGRLVAHKSRQNPIRSRLTEPTE